MNQKYYDFLARCVADMVAKGYKSEARQYVSKKVTFYSSEPRKLGYNDEPNPYYIETIHSKLNALVKYITFTIIIQKLKLLWNHPSLMAYLH